MMTWIILIVLAAVIFVAGSKLSHYGEAVAEKAGLGEGWVGLALLAIITSLSQLVASVSAVLHDLPNMAVSSLIGASMFDMMVIGMLDLTSKKQPVAHRIHQGHILSAGFGIVMVGLFTVDILFGKVLPSLTERNMDPITLSFLPLYLLAMRLSFVFERKRMKEAGEQGPATATHTFTWPKLLSLLFVSSVCIVLASYYLPHFADEIAKQTGWGESFIGSSLIAIICSLPEVAVAVTACRMGSYDMAVASLLGGNLCNIVILAICDFFYTKEPLLRHISMSNTLAALAAMISMGIIVIALTFRAERKMLFIAADAVALILIYIFANVLLFVTH